MLKSYGVGGWGGGPCDFSVSPRSKSFFFLFLGDFYSTWGPVGQGLELGLGLGLGLGLTILRRLKYFVLFFCGPVIFCKTIKSVMAVNFISSLAISSAPLLLVDQNSSSL